MAITTIPDALLVQNYVAGDELALEILINRHQSRIYGFIYSKVNDRDLADDYFQETFIRVIKTLKKNEYYNEKGKFLPWVMRIASNLIVDDFRKNKSVKMIRDTEEYSIFSIIKDIAPSVESALISEQISEDLHRIIAELPIDQQEVLKMRFFHDMSFKEIAEATNVSMNTSLGRMRYALNNIRKIIEKNNIYLSA
jgi:RNA polymerase sigma-70 factor (ECF subfamily)